MKNNLAELIYNVILICVWNNNLPRSKITQIDKKKLHPKRQKEPRKTIEETSWICETGTGQQVAQLLDSYMMMITTWEIICLLNLVLRTAVNISTVYLTVGK
jgi:hypothetical protein